MLNKIFGRTSTEHPEPHTAVTISVMCKFWLDDGVWNGSAIDLPVSVYGKTIEHAKKHLMDAIVCHLEALQEVGLLMSEIKRLQECAHECRLGVDQMTDCEFFGRTTAKVFDHKVALAACP